MTIVASCPGSLFPTVLYPLDHCIARRNCLQVLC